MHSAIALLKAMTVAFPPFSGCNHNLTLAIPSETAPDDVKESRICLTLMSTGYFSYWLNEADLARPVEDLIAEIIGLQMEALEYLGET